MVLEGSLCWYEIVQASDMAETGETQETTILMISQWVLYPFPHKQELSLVYQFIDILYNLCSLIAL